VNWEAISAIGQIVGAFAVVISLIYVAREVRRNSRATQLAAMRSIHDAFNRWSQQLGQYPHLAEVYYRGIYDFESLQPTDFVRFSAFLHPAFRLLEEAYYLQAAGHLEKGVWQAWEAMARDFNAYPGVQAWWRLRSYWFSEEFANHVNQRQQTAKAPRLFREPMEE
jgi:hypothetical protein